MPNNGSILGLALVGMSLFVLGVTAFHSPARDSETWRALATAIIVSGLIGFSSFVQQALLRQQEAEIGKIVAND